jgi:putative nucleotidyltransferase with HDIG domain
MLEKEISIRGKFTYRMNSWKESATVRFLLFFVLALFFYFSLYGILVSQTYDLEPGSVSDREIRAPKQIEDQSVTFKAQEEASRKVQPIYTMVPMKNTEWVDRIYNKIEDVNFDDGLTSAEKVEIYDKFFAEDFSLFYTQVLAKYGKDELYSNELLEEIKQKLMEQQYLLPAEINYKLLRVTSEELTEMKAVTRDIVSKLMASPITDSETARIKVAELVNSSALTQKTAREIVHELARLAITPNKFYDQTATEQARLDAKAQVQTIYIKKNDVIVGPDQVITPEIYSRLDELGLLKQDINYWPQMGLGLLVLLMTFILYMCIRQSKLSISEHNVQLIMWILIVIINILGMKLVALGQNLQYPYIGFLAPVAVGSMLIAILLGSQLALASSIIFALFSSIIFNTEYPEIIFDYRFGFVSLTVCFISIFAIEGASQRMGILKAGVLVSIFSSLAIASIILLQEEYTARELMFSLAFGFAGGLITAVLVVGLLPFFEVAFGILSPLKLVELSNPNHPLLRKLLTETPGTYHHSVMVGNLSEAAAEAIGANGLLCRVGSFYHDIGKTKRPSYFIENQSHIENPHDRIEPDLSTSIIIAHARDGKEMLKEYKMPKQICDIAEQHHGTTCLKYFYHKAIKKMEEEGKDPAVVKEDDFRYPGPKAQSKEAAIVGIADCVEAAVRSLRNPSLEQIDTMVDKIIKGRMDDNQFNECDLTLKELDIIASTLKEALLGIFHSRIEYPEELPLKGSMKA